MIVLFIFKWILKIPSPSGMRSTTSQGDEGIFIRTSPWGACSASLLQGEGISFVVIKKMIYEKALIDDSK